MIDKELKKLDEVAKKIETGELSLEASLTAFQEGIELVSKCQKSLDEAELKVKEVLKSSASFVEKDIDS